MICYDIRFPECARALGPWGLGCDVILHPSAFPKDGTNLSTAAEETSGERGDERSDERRDERWRDAMAMTAW
jgi:predicted amidohydrolase